MDSATPPVGTPSTPEAVTTQTQVTEPAQQDIQLSPEAQAAGFTADDFKNPTYGSKAKNLYKGFQSASEKAAKYEKELREINSRLEYAYKNDPEVKKALDGYAKRARGETPTEAETDAMEKQGSNPRADMEHMQAWNNFYLELGNGNPAEGRKIFNEQYQGDLREVFNSLYGTMDESLHAAKELIDLRKEKANWTKAQAPKPEAKPEPAASGESDRGTRDNNPASKPKNLDEALDRQARDQGFANFEEWQRHYLA